MNEDKTCPFCGSDDLTVKPVWKTYRFVACNKCKAGGPVCKTEEQAIAAFNHRADREDECHFDMFVPPFCPEHIEPPAFSFRCSKCGHVEWYGMPANMAHCPECHRRVVGLS